ncbi:MAG: YdcF family protein [Armatimonadota bacterium]
MRRGAAVLLVVVLAAGVVAITRYPLLTAIGRFLIVQDALGRAGVIVVLSGGVRDERVRQAAELYHAGYASRVMLSGGEAMAGLPVSDLLKNQALKHRIPGSALLFESGSTSTAEQARYLRPILEREGFRRAIVVTSSYHSRRTRYLFRSVFAGSPVEIRVYPVQGDIFSPIEWWTRDWDTEEVILEYIKLGLAVARYR